MQTSRGTPVEVARTEHARGGVVLIPEVSGIDDVAREWASRLVEAGYDVATPDLWWRGAPPPGTPEDVAAGLLADYDVLADVAAARDTLRLDRPRFLLGFDAGGLYARMGACVVFGFAGAVEFYGRVVYPTITPRKPAQPLDLLLGLSCPLQCHFGEADVEVPAAHVAELEKRLAALSQPAMVFTYPGCGHGFMNRTRPTWDAGAARTAWARAVAFLDHLAARAS